MRRLSSLAAALWIVACGTTSAQDSSPLVLQSGKELLKNPALFVGRTVVVVDGYCFYDQPNYVCIGNETPFEVKSSAMTKGPLLAAIKADCGDIQGVEHNPTPPCAYSFRFVPKSYKAGIGDYILHDEVQSNKKLIYFQTKTIEPLKR